jgi:HAD superfamily hydrolase (TIGR01509 family)|tara:strand:+ start:17628 stop:18983 length:1356 start_codon:yes stop_codon:yes gene_type:complete
MIKLVLFDLDGVLIDAKQIHYTALNEALGLEFSISEEEHHNLYDGRKTREKLEMLTLRKGLPSELHDSIFDKKQLLTIEKISHLKPITAIKELFEKLEILNYKIGVCTNSIRRTALTALSKTNLIEHCSIILSNDDVQNGKPHPEIYWKAMSMMKVLPEETLIIEDSPPGLLAAFRSRAKYLRVANPYEVTYDKIFPHLESEPMTKRWTDDKLNVLIPMAGAGSRFAQAGYTFPKPLIDVKGKPMIQVVVDNLGLDANYIFVVQAEHREKYNLDTMLNLIAPGCKIVETTGITEGAACTALLAKEYINNNNPLFFANSDQFVEWDPIEFMYNMQEKNADGGIVTFKATHPKWSFASVGEDGLVKLVAEKNPISDNATVGYYYWKQGSDFIKYAEQMVEKNIRVNNEFYVCPVFNEAISDNKEIRTHEAHGMWGLGTPEDLEHYLKNYKDHE